MKLLKCHIDSFGKLSNYEPDIKEDGLTIICEPNGFGKSTLAAFIKAMLYGMDGRTKKKLSENPWKLYNPWQGGRYGGYIEFETGGRAYRATRHFDKGDDFSLMDLATRKESKRFSKNLGKDLFELDADSFSRSTYMPQLPEEGSFNQESIHAKLGQLVNATDDLNNYDTARENLLNRRKTYQRLKGGGGSIDALKRNIDDLNSKIYTAKGKRDTFEQASADIEKLNERKQDEIQKRDSLRERIREASEREQRQMIRNRRRELERSVKSAQEKLDALDAKYPEGYPGRDEVQEQNTHLAQLRNAREDLKGLCAPSDDDRSVVKQGAALFSDADRVERDISGCRDNCIELNKLATFLASKELSASEKERLDELKEFFPDGTPAGETLTQYLNKASDLSSMIARSTEPLLSPSQQQSYDSIHANFPEGLPGEDELNKYDEMQKQAEECRRSCESLALSKEETDELNEIEELFAPGVPSDEDIRNAKQERRRILELNGKKAAGATVKQGGASFRAVAAAAVAGAALAAAGVVCFLLGQLHIAGFVLCGTGVASLAAAILIRSLRGGGGRVVSVSAISKEEIKELSELESRINNFLVRYFPLAGSGDTDIDNQIDEIAERRREYLRLKGRQTQNEANLAEKKREISSLENEIKGIFARYYPGQDFREDFVNDLRKQHTLSVSLDQTLSDSKAERASLANEIKELEDDIRSFLKRYGHDDSSAQDPEGAVLGLTNDSSEYLRLKDKQNQYETALSDAKPREDNLRTSIIYVLNHYEVYDEKAKYEDCLESLRLSAKRYNDADSKITSYDRAEESRRREEAAIREFMTKYSLSGDAGNAIVDAGIDITRREETVRALENARLDNEKFNRENPAADGPDENNDSSALPGSEELKEDEKNVLSEIDRLDSSLRDARDTRDSAKRQIEQIPAWEDEAARLSAQKEEQEERLNLLDRTIELLDAAKTKLAESYIGTLEDGFLRYSNTLIKGELGRVYVDKDLKVRIDEMGETREVESFSAGLTDCIMLCMRLSLVDTLFPNEKPFLILDDPFVNLDDAHTGRALAMLNEIAKTHQIIYLVCNTSRK